MEIVQINATSGVGSTGKICDAISHILDEKNISNHLLYVGKRNDLNPNAICYMSMVEVKINALKSKMRGNYGFNSKKSTRKLIGKLEMLKPSIIHMHNLHSHNCDLELLFNYIKRKKIKVVWTFHDCWAFTGYCTHFDMISCDKWKTECNCCEQYKKYSKLSDKSKKLYYKKKKLFEDLDMTIVTPSAWMARLISDSFLNKYPVYVINNGIDLSVFKRVEDKEFLNRLGNGKIIVLGVAFDWSNRKGLDVFINLSKKLDENYQIVLVGTNKKIDKLLPENIISIHKTKNQAELAKIYSSASIFINPTREENYPTVNMEALACGTPVITFDTGGSTEMLNTQCGISVSKNDEEALIHEILNFKNKFDFEDNTVVKLIEGFDEKKCFELYVTLYQHLFDKDNKKYSM